MISPVALQKEHKDFPDSYGIKVWYISGEQEEFELASHVYSKETQLFEFWSKDALVSWIPMSAIQRIEFDKNFTKIVEIKQETERKKNEGIK